MPSNCCHSYDLNFELKTVAEAEAVNNNREYDISESMVRKWRNQQHVLFSSELWMTAKRASMGRYRLKDPELNQKLADWFSNQRSQGKNCFVIFFVSSSIQPGFMLVNCYKCVRTVITSMFTFIDWFRSLNWYLFLLFLLLHRSSRVFDSWISTCHQGCTRKAGWTRKVCFISTLFIQRKNSSSEWQTQLHLYRY